LLKTDSHGRTRGNPLLLFEQHHNLDDQNSQLDRDDYELEKLVLAHLSSGTSGANQRTTNRTQHALTKKVEMCLDTDEVDSSDLLGPIRSSSSFKQDPQFLLGVLF
jgi:hypothetical protein